MTPIHKGGSVDDNNNYRPLSVRSYFSKILERDVHHQLIDIVGASPNKNAIQYRRQNSMVIDVVSSIFVEKDLI